MNVQHLLSYINVYAGFYLGFVTHGFSFWTSASCVWKSYLSSHRNIFSQSPSVLLSLPIITSYFCYCLSSLVWSLLSFCSALFSPPAALSSSLILIICPYVAFALHLTRLHFLFFSILPLLFCLCRLFSQIHHASETTEINVGLCMDGF